MILWTPAMVEERVREAIVTLRRVPAGRIRPAGLKTNWPDVVRDWQAYGWDPAARPRVQATAEDIARMDEVLGWTSRWLSSVEAEREGLPPDAVRVLMARAGGVRWDVLGLARVEWWGARPTVGGGRSAIPGGNSYPSLRRIYDGALALLARRLNGGRDHEAPARLRQDEGPRYEEVVEVTFPAGEEGSYGPVHARARWVYRPSRKRGM